MKNIIILSVLIIIWGFTCPSFEYNGSQRFQVVGTVTNTQKEPLDSIEVKLFGIVDTDDKGLLQDVHTDINGNFDFIHSGSNAAYYIMYINPQRHNAIHFSKYNPLYATKRIIFTEEEYTRFYLNLDAVSILDKGIPVRIRCKDDSINKTQNMIINSAKSDVTFNTGILTLFHNHLTFTCRNAVVLYFPQEDTLYMRYDNVLDTLILGNTGIDYTLL